MMSSPETAASVLARFLLVPMLLLACTSHAEEPDQKAEPSPTPEGRLEVPVPEGVPVKGIRIPHYNEDGELAMEFEAEEARRVSENLIELDDLEIRILDEDEKEYDITMAESTFNLDTRVLKSNTRVTIQREDFEIVGDSAEFDVKTRKSKMFGFVKMTIFNPDALK